MSDIFAPHKCLFLSLIMSLSMYRPLGTVLGVFDCEASLGETVAYEVAGGPVLGVFGLGAHLEDEFHGFLKRFHDLGVVGTSGYLGTNAENVDEEGVKHTL